MCLFQTVMLPGTLSSTWADEKKHGGMSSDTDGKNHRGVSNGTILSDTYKKSQTHGYS